jgi:small subunit ribosomal protein S4
MAIINVKKYKVARRLGAGVYEKTQTQKFMLAQARGMRTAKRPSRPTDYGKQLIEKQRVRFTYGVRERQFSNYVKLATEKPAGTTPALRLFALLETRLDNVVYRLGLAHTRGLSRQLVSHGHFLVNGKRTTVPSYTVREGDIIEIREGSKDIKVFDELDKKLKDNKTASWLNWDNTKMKGQIKGTPKDPDPFLNLQAVIEFYSR